MPLKTCTACQDPKDLENDFNKKKSSPDGRQNVCRQCNKDKCNAYYEANKTKHKKAVQVYKKKYKEEAHRWLIQYLSDNPCVDCGEEDIRCLEFDHVRGKKSRNISNLLQNVVSLENIQKEIKKCDVRCANCHRKRTADVQGWYKTGP